MPSDCADIVYGLAGLSLVSPVEPPPVARRDPVIGIASCNNVLVVVLSELLNVLKNVPADMVFS